MKQGKSRAGPAARGAEECRRSTGVQLEGLSLERGSLDKEAAQARRLLDLSTTKSDRDGVLTWVLPEVGATVRKGDVLARVADLPRIASWPRSPTCTRAKLAAGMRAHVKLDDTTTIDGTISSIDPRIENGIAKFYVTLDQRAHPRLRNNLRVDVLPILGSHGNVLRVRRGALGQGEREEVFVVRGNVLVRTLVRWGWRATK